MAPRIFFLPVWIIMFPTVMAFVIYYLERRSEKVRNVLAVATSAVTFLSVAALYPVIFTQGKIIDYRIFQLLPNLGISLRVDILSFSLALLSSFIWMLVAVYSIDYMRKDSGGNRYYPALILTLAGCMGIFLAGDLFTLFVFFELMSLVSYVLVVHDETAEALRAGYKYLIMTIIGGLALFFGIIATFELSGSVSLSGPALISQPSNLAFFAFLSFLVGFGMKAGMFPLHVWLPDAHPVAPSPASALLSGIMLKTGAYGLLRVIFHVFGLSFMQDTGWNVIIAVVAVITIMLGSAVAVTQDDLKRRLAYSSIGQMGYILLGMSILNSRALMGDIFHIFSHALMKSTLFLAAGAIILKTGRRSIKDLGGIGKKMPFTMSAFTLAALALIGLPPFNGFLSKWTLSLGAMDAGMPVYVIILLISSLLSGLYYLPIIIAAFFGAENAPSAKMDEAPYKMLVPLAILAVSCLLFGLLPTNLPYDLSRVAAEYLLKGGF